MGTLQKKPNQSTNGSKGQRQILRQRIRQSWRQAPPEEANARDHHGSHQAGHPPSCEKRRCQAHLRVDLRRGQTGVEDIPRERCERLSDLLRARQEKDSDSSRRCVCAEETGQDPLRFRWLIGRVKTSSKKCSSLSNFPSKKTFF